MGEMFVEQVLKLKNSGKSVLLSSHILSEIERLCDRVGVIMKGNLIKTGTIDELKQGVGTMEELFMKYYQHSQEV
jgi:ABC-2 type transport system ATP-binding protein